MVAGAPGTRWKRQRLLERLAILLLLVFLAAVPLPAGAAVIPPEDPGIRVGVYHAPPFCGIGDDGTVSGFGIDILEYVAAEEGWRIVYVPGTWPECMARLEREEIDLLAAIAYTEERDRLFDFSRESLVVDWGQIVSRRGAGFFSVADLDGKRIAVLEDDVYYASFRELADLSGIHCTFVVVGDYRAVFRAVDEEIADAGLVGRSTGYLSGIGYDIEETPIVCSPKELLFAAPSGKNSALLDDLDRHLSFLKADPESVYYRSLGTWLGGAPRQVVPEWIGVAVGSALLLAGCFFGGFLLLRREVARRTEELRSEVEGRRRAETAFAESERRFKAALKHSPVFVFHQDRQLTYTWVFNAPGNRAPDTFLGRTDADLFLPEDAALLTRLKRQVLESGSDLKAEIPVTLDGQRHRFSLTLEPERDREGDVGGLIGVVIDITEKARQEEQIREALYLIDRNFEQLATLNDHIRNPLQVIVGLAAMTEGRTAEIILAQSEEIDDLVRKLDMGWLESMKIREFLVRHYAPPEDE